MDSLIWHHFGSSLKNRPQELVEKFKRFLVTRTEPENLAKLVEQYNHRSAIAIQRDENIIQKGDSYTLKVLAH